MGLYQTKVFLRKEIININRIKSLLNEEGYLQTHINKGIIPRSTEKLIQLDVKNTQTSQFKNRQNTWIDILPKKTYVVTDMWGDALYH